MAKKQAKNTRVVIDEDMHRRFKALCALKGIRLKDAATEAIGDWMERQEGQKRQ